MKLDNTELLKFAFNFADTSKTILKKIISRTLILKKKMMDL